MNGIAARAIERFVCDTYGEAAWHDVVRRARLPVNSFELLLTYPENTTARLVATSTAVLGRQVHDLMEDLGTYLVTHDNMAAVRRLLRYGGADFESFLDSLDDLPDRTRLAFPELVLPRLRTRPRGAGAFDVECGEATPLMVHVLAGAIRAMADDYGALAVLDVDAPARRIAVSVPALRHSAGRDFHLGGATR